MTDKFSRYLLIAILIVVLIILYFVFTNKKETNAQSDLLLAMADKLGTRIDKQEYMDQVKESVKSEMQQIVPREETPEDGPEIVRIAEKIYSGHPLTKEEKNFQAIFPDQIAQELEFSKTYHAVVKKLVEEIELSEDEETFYYENKLMIDREVQLAIGNRQSAINSQQTAARIQEPSTIKGANPPLAPEERKKLILGFFNDGIPKNITQLTEIYAKATGTKPSKGNISGIFGKLEGRELLCQEIQHNSRWKVFYGLPHWFEDGKLKKEFKTKIQ